jgi:hypothetical protein
MPFVEQRQFTEKRIATILKQNPPKAEFLNLELIDTTDIGPIISEVSNNAKQASYEL